MRRTIYNGQDDNNIRLVTGPLFGSIFTAVQELALPRILSSTLSANSRHHVVWKPSLAILRPRHIEDLLIAARPDGIGCFISETHF